MKKNPKISIIVPIYNASDKLKILLESVLRQTYQNYELILIDDGSKDDSLEKMKEYQRKYPERIKIYTRENQGVSKTRNEGLKYTDDLIFTLPKIEEKLSGYSHINCELLEYFYLRSTLYCLLFSSKKVENKEIDKDYEKLWSWYENVKEIRKRNRYQGIFKNDGEQFLVKWIISIFCFLKKMHLDEIFLHVYCKI